MVLRGARIEAVGIHAELLAQCGYYPSLFGATGSARGQLATNDTALGESAARRMA